MTAVLSGKITSVAAHSFPDAHPVLEITADRPGFAIGSPYLVASSYVVRPELASADTSFVQELLASDEVVPPLLYTMTVRWLDTGGQIVGVDSISGLRIPAGQVDLSQLLSDQGIPWSYAYIGPTPPAIFPNGAWWLATADGSLGAQQWVRGDLMELKKG